MSIQETIDAGATVNETIRRFPATVAIFSAFGIDACCGGAVPVREAAERHGMDPDALLAAL
ncbi:MAG TPA: DUF542 domain-containing protein, partial [Longimicrobiaceae bacterium]|nr:DUF542 domain-containing protein [Longimicrobiaceae bacterium]